MLHAMLHEDSVHTMPTMQQQCNVHGAMFTTQCSRRKVNFDEILCWVDNYRQPYNALPTGNQDIVSTLAQWGLTKSHGWRNAQARGIINLTGDSILLQFEVVNM